MPKIKLVSSDLNGTLVHQHTMSDMIRLYVGEKQYRQANDVFTQQTNGNASMELAFSTAGPLTRGLSLRQAIEYTKTHMSYMDGFATFVGTLAENSIPLVINSTGYSVTAYSIEERIGGGRIHGHIGNFLKFAMNANPHETLNEDELRRKVHEYFVNPESTNDNVYDIMQATGLIELGIMNEGDKARLIREYATRHFDGVSPGEIAHIGDTMGDSCGIVGIAQAGGIGIAFNYNDALKKFLENAVRNIKIPGEIYLIEPKSKYSNLEGILPILLR